MDNEKKNQVEEAIRSLVWTPLLSEGIKAFRVFSRPHQKKRDFARIVGLTPSELSRLEEGEDPKKEALPTRLLEVAIRLFLAFPYGLDLREVKNNTALDKKKYVAARLKAVTEEDILYFIEEQKESRKKEEIIEAEYEALQHSAPAEEASPQSAICQEQEGTKDQAPPLTFSRMDILMLKQPIQDHPAGRYVIVSDGFEGMGGKLHLSVLPLFGEDRKLTTLTLKPENFQHVEKEQQPIREVSMEDALMEQERERAKARAAALQNNPYAPPAMPSSYLTWQPMPPAPALSSEAALIGLISSLTQRLDALHARVEKLEQDLLLKK